MLVVENNSIKFKNIKLFYEKSDEYFSNLFPNKFLYPRIKFIVLNLHAGSKNNLYKNFLYETYDWFGKISNQKPLVIVNRKDNDDFKIRKGTEIGLKTTLRGKNYMNFFCKLIYIANYKIVNFKGWIDNLNNGNLDIGIKNANIFDEIDYQKIKYNFGFNINICTNTKNNSYAKKMFELLNMKFKK